MHGHQGFPGGSDGKESGCNAGDLSSIPRLGRSPEEGKGYPLQYSGLENSVDRSFIDLFYTSVKLHYTKALSNQALSLAPDRIPLLQRPRMVSFMAHRNNLSEGGREQRKDWTSHWGEKNWSWSGDCWIQWGCLMLDCKNSQCAESEQISVFSQECLVCWAQATK